MLQGAQWRVINQNNEQDIIDRILENRGLTSPALKEQFLNPDFNRHLHSPYLLKDMEKAVERIMTALKKNEKIVIFGDYDADGVTATALLYDFFRQNHPKIDYILPHRLNDGYGVTPTGVIKAEELGASLIITVDNGMNAISAAEEAQKRGIDLIITDHHQQGNELPVAHAIVNPNRHDCAYPFKQISGAGVAYKLVTALAEKILSPKDAEYFLKWSLDLVAMGTVADIMPLIDENRTLVYFGLKVISESKRPGIRALLNANGKKQQRINTVTIGYQLGPRINAAGRLEKADIALKLLIANDYSEALSLAKKLDEVNQLRQEMTQKALDEAERGLDQNEKIIIVNSADWHPGIIGLVAGKLCEKYNRPVLAFSKNNEHNVYKGSARSPEYFDITEAMMSFSELLENVGGHRQAGGCTVTFEQYNAFCKEIGEYASKLLKKTPVTRLYEAETILLPREISLESWEKIQKLAPFGNENPNPLFLVENASIQLIRTVGFKKRHLQLKLNIGDKLINAIGFGLGDFLKHLQPGQKIDLMAEISVNTWNNNTSIQLVVKDIRPSLGIDNEELPITASNN